MKALNPQIANETMTSTVTTSLRFQVLGSTVRSEKEIKGINTIIEEIKTGIICRHITVHTEYPSESTHKLWAVISEFN